MSTNRNMDAWEYDIASINFRLDIDGDVVETSYLDFVRENLETLDNDTWGAIQSLGVGESYADGGGASPEWTLTRVS